jgi:hypothetical protein
MGGRTVLLLDLVQLYNGWYTQYGTYSRVMDQEMLDEKSDQKMPRATACVMQPTEYSRRDS